MRDTGIQCDRCGDGPLQEPEEGANYECPDCGAVVAPEIARGNRFDVL